MRKQVFGRKFKRHANARRALLRGLITDLVIREKITTTEEKAKAIKGQVEKLVTKAKTQGEKAKRLLQPYLSDAGVEKVIKDLAVRFANRPGGYVRIVKLGERFGDNASMAIIEWVEKGQVLIEGATDKGKEIEETPTKDNGKSKVRASKKSKPETKKIEKKTKKK